MVSKAKRAGTTQATRSRKTRVPKSVNKKKIERLKTPVNNGTAQKQERETIAPENVEEHIAKIRYIDNKLRGPKKWIYEFLRYYFDPQLIGVDNIDKQRPTLFVSNHALLGMDGAITPLAILDVTGKLPRLFSDSILMASPMADFAISLGLVWANPIVSDTLMNAGENLMVFPGGYREGTKKKDELYQLMWEGRTGFVKQAIKHGYTITPFANVGPDDIWDIIWDKDDIKGTRFDKFMDWALPNVWDSERFPPIPKGMGWSIFPHPERFYHAFGKPIDMAPYAGKEDDENVLTDIKNLIEAEVDGLIKETMILRARQRPRMTWLRKRLTRL